MTPLYILNFVLLQWLGVRLARVVDDDDGETSWAVLRWIIPLTGWWSPYRYLRGFWTSREASAFVAGAGLCTVLNWAEGHDPAWLGVTALACTVIVGATYVLDGYQQRLEAECRRLEREVELQRERGARLEEKGERLRGLIEEHSVTASR